jgi:hypothetical protein
MATILSITVRIDNVRHLRIVTMSQWLSRAVAVLVPSHGDRSDALRGDLQRLGALAERTHHQTRPAG